MQSGTAAWTSPSTNPIATARRGISAARGRQLCAGRCMRPPRPHGAPAHPTASTTSRQPSASAEQPRLPGTRAQTAQTLLPHAARTRRGRTRATPRPTAPHAKRHPQDQASTDPQALQTLWLHDHLPRVDRLRASSPHSLMRRGWLPHRCCRHVRVDGLERLSGRNASPSGITPSNILSPTPKPTRGSWTEVRLGARTQTIRFTHRAHAPPCLRRRQTNNPERHLTPPPDK